MHAVRIAVDPTDKPWIVNREHQVCRRVGNRWEPLPGQFSEISIGANGAVYALGLCGEGDSNGSPIYNWTGTSWQAVRGAATRIAVAPNGVPWIVTPSHTLYRLPDGDEWRQMPGRLVDIAFGTDGSAWALGPPEDETADGYPLLHWHDRGWEKFPGHAKRVAVDEIGGPWIVNARHEVFRVLEGFCWHEVPGMVTEIATGPNGSAWAIGRARTTLRRPLCAGTASGGSRSTAIAPMPWLRPWRTTRASRCSLRRSVTLNRWSTGATDRIGGKCRAGFARSPLSPTVRHRFVSKMANASLWRMAASYMCPMSEPKGSKSKSR